jgi:YgiT-type zinc finger domain-containing protein
MKSFPVDEMQTYPEEHLMERLVTYTIERDGELVIVEHVPARVNVETGERLFSPDTVRRLQRIVWERGTPTRTIQTPVFDFAA